MAQRDSKKDGAPGSARSRQRGKPVQVQAKTPWGFIAGSTVVGLALLGVVAYAVLNQGAGFRSQIKIADAKFDGSLALADASTLKRNHVEGPVAYAQKPPNGGDHNAVPQTCQVYTQPIADEHAVHSLEHGAVWITYQPSLPPADVATLAKLAEGQSYVLMSPYPGQTGKVDVSAWGRRLSVDSAGDPKVAEFVDTYADGPQTPEKGALCSGTTDTGPVRPAAVPAPAASPAG